MAKIKKLYLSFILCFCSFILSSCYIPDDFVGDVVINKNGNFTLSYKGILTWAPFYGKLKNQEYSEAEAKAKIASIKTDLERDSHFTQIESIGNAQFKVKYLTRGIIKIPSQFTFLRRDSMIMKIVTLEDGVTEFKGRWLTPEKVKKLLAEGLNVKGTFKVKTNAEVLRNNAEKVEKLKDGYFLYTWSVDNFKKSAPMLALKLDMKSIKQVNFND